MNKANPWLYRFSQFVVLATFGLIFWGGMVTSKGAGLSVPDWPTSYGYSMFTFPMHDWIGNIRIEHTHRLLAMIVASLTAILAAWIWRNFWSLLAAVIVSAAAGFLGGMAHLHEATVGILSVWPAAIVFVLVLVLMDRQSEPKPLPLPLTRWMALISVLGVCLQATIGGLRVVDMSIALAVLHGFVAQLFLCSLIVIAVSLSPFWIGNHATTLRVPKSLRVGAWVLTGVVIFQLIIGTVMRHLGAGLAIPYFPEATKSGSWLPVFGKNPMADLNFLHTRFGAAAVCIAALFVVCVIFFKVWREKRLLIPAILLVALLVFQVELGMHIIWLKRPPVTTTLHVVNGAAVLGMSLLIALRAYRLRSKQDEKPLEQRIPEEALS